MFGGTTAAIRMIAVLIIVAICAAGLWYVTGLRADLAISQDNAKKLTDAIDQQAAAISQMRQEQQQIRDINNQLNTTIQLQNKDLTNLQDRFTQNAAGEKRDFAKTAAAKPEALERAVNRGTVNALRCLEIASGSPLTEAEKAASKPSEINRECPSLANPNYKPAVVN
jgi:septal ring factor EnvC (AmiA/AmiB activator)